MKKGKIKSTLTRDIEFLYEIGTLRFVDRTWQQFYLKRVANNAEHIFRVIWIALIIARHEKIKNEERVLKMALLHDLGESRAPDTNYLSKFYSSRNEEKVIKDMFSETALPDEWIGLFKEYEERKTIESQIVKDADNLDVDFEIEEHAATGSQNLRKLWTRKEVYDRFYTKTAKKMWKELQMVNPQEWHVKAFRKNKLQKRK